MTTLYELLTTLEETKTKNKNDINRLSKYIDNVIDLSEEYNSKIKSLIEKFNIQGAIFEDNDMYLIDNLRSIMCVYTEITEIWNDKGIDETFKLDITLRFKVPNESEILYNNEPLQGEYFAKIIADNIRCLFQKYIGEEYLKCLHLKYSTYNKKITQEYSNKSVFLTLGMNYYAEMFKRTIYTYDHELDQSEFIIELTKFVLHDKIKYMKPEEISDIEKDFLDNNIDIMDKKVSKLLEDHVIQKGIELAKSNINKENV